MPHRDNSPTGQYHALMEDILDNGIHCENRTGIDTHSVFGRVMRFNISEGKVPLLHSKKVFTKGIIHELIWMLSGDTNIRYLKQHGVNIWDSWVKKGTEEYVDADVPETVEQVARRYIHNLSHPETQTMSKFYKKGEYRKLNETEITELLAMRPRPANGLKPVDLEERILYVAFDVLLSPEGNPSTTICRIYITPTFSVMGHSNVLDHINYNEKLGNHYAYLEAFDKLWDYVAVIKHFSTEAVKNTQR